MKRKKIIFLLFAGMLLVLSGAGFSEKKTVFANSTLKKGSIVTVEGSVYDAGGQLLTDRFAIVQAGTTVSPEGGADGDVYTSAIDENGRYHLELPVGFYYFHFQFHNRSFGQSYFVNKNCLIDLRMGYNFYQMSGKVYLNGQPYHNGILRLQRKIDDPENTYDDYYTELETDENGYYEFCFIEGIDGDFSAQYKVKGAMYDTNDIVNIPGTNISGYNIYISGEVSQDPLPTLAPTAGQSAPPASTQTTEPSASPALTQTTVKPIQPPKDSASPDNAVKNTTVNKNFLKKGMTFTQKGLRYKIISYTTKKKEVMLLGSTKKNVKKIVIPTAVTTKKVSFRVVAITAKAFYRQKKLSFVSIGSNIQRIGTQAFCKDSGLRKVVFKTKKLRKVGTNAFVGINNNARIIIPTSCKKKYIRLLEGRY